MALPSRVLSSGFSQLSTIAICGNGQDDITAAGTSAGNATQLVAIYNSIDTTSSGSGVLLPKAEQGAMLIIANSGAHSLTVYPQTSDTINQTTSAAVPQNRSSIFFAVSNTQWYSLSGNRS